MPIQDKAQHAPWLHLSAKLQMMILEDLRDLLDKEPRSNTQKIKGPLYAVTCREWQHFFEKESFRYMTLHQSDICEFGRIVQGERKAYVQWIWLRLELPKYDCSKCDLSLASDFLRPLHYDRLLQAAAIAARRMHQLEGMELWDSNHHTSCIFRYRLEDDIPKTQLLSTWDGEISGQAMVHWREAAGKHRPELQAELGHLESHKLNSHRRTLQLLAFREQIVTDASYRQILLGTWPAV